MYIERWVGKENVVDTYNRILFSLKKQKEILLHATTWINFEDIVLSEMSQPQTTDIIWFHLNEESKVVKNALTGVAQLVGAPSHKAYGRWFNSWSCLGCGHVQEATDRCFSMRSMFLSLSFSLPSPLFKKIVMNKIFKNSQTHRSIKHNGGCQGLGGGEMGSCCSMSIQFQSYKMKKF